MSHVASDVTLITGLVSVLDVNVCVPPTVTTLAVFVPAVVTLTSSEKVNKAHAHTASNVTHPVELTVVE